MSAHICRALPEIRDHAFLGQFFWEGLGAALSISTWTEQLDLDEYRNLREIVDEQNPYKLTYWIGIVLPKYQAAWEHLGKPTTREDWVHKSWMELCFTPGMKTAGYQRMRIRLRRSDNVAHLPYQPGDELDCYLCLRDHTFYPEKPWKVVLAGESGFEMELDDLDFCPLLEEQ